MFDKSDIDDNTGIQIESRESCLTTWRHFRNNFSRRIRIWLQNSFITSIF